MDKARLRQLGAHKLVVTVVLVGLAAVGWLSITAAKSWLYYRGLDRDPYRTSHLRIAAKKAVSAVLEPYYDARLTGEGRLPEYELVSSEKRAQEWHEILERVYARGHAEESDRVWLPARLRHRGRVWEVDFRPRGTLYTHYKVEKPSFRLKFPRDEYFRGQRILNLIIPYDQARVVGDTSINAVARHYGLLTYPTRFVTLRMNGDMLGVYQEVPHFRKELAVHQFRSEGFFMSSLGEAKGSNPPEAGSAFAESMAEFSRCVRQTCSEEEARQLLAAYVDGEKMAAYAALTTVFGASHAWGEDNLILFFDPPRGRLEPVPWDMGTLHLPSESRDPFEGLESVKGIGALFTRLEEFRDDRDRMIWDIVVRQMEFARAESERLFADIEPALNLDTEHSRRYTRRFPRYFQQALEVNFRLWREHLEAVSLGLAPIGLESKRPADTEAVLEVRNHAAASVWVEELHLGDPTASGAEHRIVLHQPLKIPGRYGAQIGRAQLGREELGLSPSALSKLLQEIDGSATGESARPIALVGRNHISGQPFEHRVSAPEPPSLEMAEASPIASGQASIPPAGVRLAGSADSPEWVFAGDLALDENLVLAPGVRARFEPGLRLTLGPDVSLIVQGDLHSMGTQEKPIWVGAEDIERPFAFLAVLGRSQAKVAVSLAHTTIQGGREGRWRASTFTGMVSIYDGHLQMHSSQILDARGEDGLNVKFGLVEMIDNRFERIASDAVDLDFCRGVVRGNRFASIAADGLDLSGSWVLAEGNGMENLRDKGFSIGEATTVLMRGNDVRRATTGAAVKDSSVAEIHPGSLEELEVGLAIYQKKQSFGSGKVSYEGTLPMRATTRLLADAMADLEVLQSGSSSEALNGSQPEPPR